MTCISHAYLEPLRNAQEAITFAAAEYQAAEAGYKLLVAQAKRDAGFKINAPVAICFDCGLCRGPEDANEKGHLPPCPQCMSLKGP